MCGHPIITHKAGYCKKCGRFLYDAQKFASNTDFCSDCEPVKENLKNPDKSNSKNNEILRDKRFRKYVK